jgi:MFS family permease
MFSDLPRKIRTYPSQFWLISFLMMLAWLFFSLIWSYLLLYISQKMGQPLSSISWLMTLNAIVGMGASFLGGNVADRFGRKGVMVLSLLITGVGWFFYRAAGTLPVFALLTIITGATTPLYRLTADAMVADLVPVEKRLDAYSILRMGNNLGVAIGPVVGGLLVSLSYFIAFSVMGIGFAVIGLLAFIFIRESRDWRSGERQTLPPAEGGYRAVFKDAIFMRVIGAYTLNRVCTSILWMMLAAYTSQNFGLSESRYGFIPATNAVMVILLQLFVTRRVNHHRPQAAMSAGALVYAVSIFSISFGTGFWWFWLCMVGATIGEMILVPTTTTFTSRLAPANMRARYMSVYTLTWTVGTGLGPLLAGFASDLFAPRAMWYAAGLAGFAAFFIFLNIARSKPALDTRLHEGTMESV